MKKAIFSLHREEEEKLLNEGIQEYDKALGGQANFPGKFVIEWRRLNRGIKVRINSKLPLIIPVVIESRELASAQKFTLFRLEGLRPPKTLKLKSYDRQT